MMSSDSPVHSDTAQTRIRAARPSDASALHRMASDKATAAAASFIQFSTVDYWHARLQGANQPLSDRTLLVAEERSVIGFAQLTHELGMPIRRHVATVTLCVDVEHRRKGVGHRLLEATLEHAHGWLGLTRIELFVWSDHAAARSLYARHGFVEEGLFKAFGFRDGRYVDAIAMARLTAVPTHGHATSNG